VEQERNLVLERMLLGVSLKHGHHLQFFGS
jgi:hypothetical protein